MRSSVTRSYAVAVSIALTLPVSVTAQGYVLTILQGLGGGAAANSINDRGWVAGVANDAGDTVSHAALWVGGPTPLDLGTLGAPSLNSAIAWPVKSNNGVIVGISDTNEINPLGEAFSCWAFFAPGAPTGRICKGFRWEKGRMSPLPPFAGGYNSYAAGANKSRANRRMGGKRRIRSHLRSRLSAPAVSRRRSGGRMVRCRTCRHCPATRSAPPPPSTTRDKSSASLESVESPLAASARGTRCSGKTACRSISAISVAIRGTRRQRSTTPASSSAFLCRSIRMARANYRAFVWTRDRGIRKLDELAGTVRSTAWGLNDDSQIVGSVRLAGASPFAAMWQMPDAPIQNLNDLVPSGSPLLTIAGDINNDGKIAGSTASGSVFSRHHSKGRSHCHILSIRLRRRRDAERMARPLVSTG